MKIVNIMPAKQAVHIAYILSFQALLIISNALSNLLRLSNYYGYCRAVWAAKLQYGIHLGSPSLLELNMPAQGEIASNLLHNATTVFAPIYRIAQLGKNILIWQLNQVFCHF
ncbi:MAG: hypothetical protein QOI11_3426 [Candidatus Eremiobacteraeota bacterium]|nr:hypothetical protein [Candidatus Eremiobacteraeota bacterium]